MGTQMLCLDSWKGVEAALDPLMLNSTACLKGPGLQEVCAAVERLAPVQPPPDAVVFRMRCFVKVMHLLATVFAARRRVRDWRQQDYSSRVVTALAAATAVLRCLGSQHNNIAAKLSTRLLADTGVLGLVAAAQREITQLLSTQHSQQPGDRKQQQQQQQGQALILQVAHQLLLWWVEAHKLWMHNPGRTSLASATTAAAAEGYFAHHVLAVELAAAVAQSAGHSCTPEQFLVLVQVEQRLAGQDRSRPFSSVARGAVTAHYSTAAYLQLSLTMLLMHTYLASPAAAPLFVWGGQAAAMSGTSSSYSGGGSSDGGGGSSGASSSGCCSGGSGGGDGSSGSGAASAAAAAAADASAAAGRAAATIKEQHWQKLQQNVTGMWQLLGLQPDSLLAFAEAMLADVRVLKGILDASHHETLGNDTKPLPKGRPPMLQARYRTLTELSAALFAVMRPPSMDGAEWCADGMPVSLDAHSRQQQQLLQAVCWVLPELLLRSALLCGEGEPLVVETAASATIWVMCYWHAPGMEAAAAAAKPQQLPAVLDCWLQLMQQQLLLQPQQQPGSTSQQQQQQPGSTSQQQQQPQPQQQPQQQQQQQPGSASKQQQQPGSASQQPQQQQPLGLLWQLAATARVLQSNSTAAQQLLSAGWCSCDSCEDDSVDIYNPDKHSSSNSSNSSSNSSSHIGSISFVRLRCDSLEAVGHLLECLGAMKVPHTCLTPRAGSVMLLLEVLARRVMAHHITCANSTSSSSSSSSSGGGGSTGSQRSSSAARLWQQLLQLLASGNADDERGILPTMFGIAAAEQPQLQPSLLALLASLHKLSRQQDTQSQVSVAEVAARYAKCAIHKLSDAGVPRLVDLRTWRAMIAPWVVLIGLYCCELGRWLQRWHRQQLQALQQPDSSISSSRKTADTVLEQFIRFHYAAEDVIGYPALQLVESLWASGTTTDSSSGGGGSSTEGWDSDLTGAEYVDRWQQWKQSAAAAGGQQLQRQQPVAATAAAGVQGSAAAAAASQQSASVPTGKEQHQEPPPQQHQQQQQPMPPLPPQQQQQVLAPGFGSLEEDFSLISTEITTYFEFAWHVSHATQKHLKRLQRSTPPEPRGSQQNSSSSSGSSSTSSISDLDESSGGDDSSGEDDSSEDEGRDWVEVREAAERKVQRAKSIHSSMEACLGYEGFSELAELLQGVGEAICAKLPVPWMCNNPGCTCMSGASELQLVGGKACVCGGCGVARYCGASCQAAHWQQHKPVCRELAAQAAAAEAAAAAATASGAGSSGFGSRSGSVTAHIVL